MFSRTLRRVKTNKSNVKNDSFNQSMSGIERQRSRNGGGVMSTLLRRKKKNAPSANPAPALRPTEGDQEQYDLFHNMYENGYEPRTIEVTMRKAGLDPTIVLGANANHTSTDFLQQTLKRKNLIKKTELSRSQRNFNHSQGTLKEESYSPRSAHEALGFDDDDKDVSTQMSSKRKKKVFLARQDSKNSSSFANFSEEEPSRAPVPPPLAYSFSKQNPLLNTGPNRLTRMSSAASLTSNQSARHRFGSSFSMMEMKTAPTNKPPRQLPASVKRKKMKKKNNHNKSFEKISFRSELEQSLSKLDPERFTKQKAETQPKFSQPVPEAHSQQMHHRYKIKYQPNPLDAHASSASLLSNKPTNISSGGSRRPLSDRPMGSGISSAPQNVPKDALSFRNRNDGMKLKILAYDSPVYYQYKLMQIDNLDVQLIVQSLLNAELDPVVLYPTYWDVNCDLREIAREGNQWEKKYSKRYLDYYFQNKRTGEVLWRNNNKVTHNSTPSKASTRLSKMTDFGFGELDYDDI